MFFTNPVELLIAPFALSTKPPNILPKLSVATNESWKNQSGETQERTEWHRVVMYGKMAETASEYMKKGQTVYVEGRLQTNEWEDQNQVKRKTTEIRCDNFTMLGRRSDSAQGSTMRNDKTEDQDDDLPF